MKFLPGVFNEAFDDIFHDHSYMRCDIQEQKDCFLLDMELPGYQKENPD